MAGRCLQLAMAHGITCLLGASEMLLLSDSEWFRVSSVYYKSLLSLQRGEFCNAYKQLRLERSLRCGDVWCGAFGAHNMVLSRNLSPESLNHLFDCFSESKAVGVGMRRDGAPFVLAVSPEDSQCLSQLFMTDTPGQRLPLSS